MDSQLRANAPKVSDSFSIDDVGLINSIKTLRNMNQKPTKEEILALSIPWKTGNPTLPSIYGVFFTKYHHLDLSMF